MHGRFLVRQRENPHPMRTPAFRRPEGARKELVLSFVASSLVIAAQVIPVIVPQTSRRLPHYVV